MEHRQAMPFTGTLRQRDTQIVFVCDNGFEMTLQISNKSNLNQQFNEHLLKIPLNKRVLIKGHMVEIPAEVTQGTRKALLAIEKASDIIATSPLVAKPSPSRHGL